MDEAQRNKQLVLDAYSGRPGALLAALAIEVEYTLMGSTHRFARTFHGRDDVVQNLFAEVGAVLASGRMIPINALGVRLSGAPERPLRGDVIGVGAVADGSNVAKPVSTIEPGRSNQQPMPSISLPGSPPPPPPATNPESPQPQSPA